MSAARFYTEIVGCRHLATVGAVLAFLDAAGTCLILVQRDPPINPRPEDHGGVHHSFAIAHEDYPAALDHLRQNGVEISFEEDRQGGVVNGPRAYFHDPDGTVLEFIELTSYAGALRRRYRARSWKGRTAMANAKPYIIALEEHYQDAELRGLTGGPGFGAAGGAGGLEERLADLGTLRLREMDESGIGFQVLSHSIPGLEAVDAATGVPLARRLNDRLSEAVRAHPDRFGAFAALPTADARAAADELERTVTKLGFKGAMINGLTNSVFHDDERFWPIYERAQALDVPIYIHPAIPQPAVIEAYYKDYAQKHPGLLRAGWGFNVETATQGIRFVLSGVFDAYPGLKVILGHMGEGIPFYLWRISHGLRQSMSQTTFRDIFCEHFWITTSGFFSDPALVCCMMEMGIDRILFSVDYPFMDNPPGAEWIKTLPLSAEDTKKLLNGNARRLLKL